jgi:hypothetical protein
VISEEKCKQTDREMSFLSFIMEISENKENEKRVFPDLAKFKCVWLRPEPNMEMINQFMDDIKVYHNESFADKSPSNISELLSSSFPSGGEAIEDLVMEAEPYDVVIPTSTPQHKHNETERESAKRRRTQQAFKEFNDASPIPFTSQYRDVFIKRRCRLSFDDLENVENVEPYDMKMMKLSESFDVPRH